MKKSEIFDTLIKVVADVCEVEESDIVNDSKNQSVVAARALTVHYLKRIGLTSDEISRIVLRRQENDPVYKPSLEQIKSKSKAIDKMAMSYYVYKNAPNPQAFELQEMDVKKFCHEEYERIREPWMASLD